MANGANESAMSALQQDVDNIKWKWEYVIEIFGQHRGETNFQDVIDLAVEKDKIVRLFTTKSNEAIRKEIVDYKGCEVLKGTVDDMFVGVYPASKSPLI